MGFEDKAEDVSDPAVQARHDAFVKNRHYPADTYRIQDACANCRHVFVRQAYDDGDELYCTFGAPGRPLCMSIPMGECECGPRSELVSEQADARREQWESWKVGRQVVAHGICGEWAPTEKPILAGAVQKPDLPVTIEAMNEAIARAGAKA
jgi:hypothetical protein